MLEKCKYLFFRYMLFCALFTLYSLTDLEKENIVNSLKKQYVKFNDSFSSVEKRLRIYKLSKLYNLSATHKAYLDPIKELYLKNSFNKLTSERVGELKIPKIIHQIWLGSKLPDGYKKWQSSWKKHHPTWKYILWTDEKVKGLKLHNRAQFDKTKNFAEKADILRYEILYQMGGLYVDTDFECLRPFDKLHHVAKFYMGVCNRPGLTCNALIASVPGHEILKQVVHRLKHHASKVSIIERTGPILLRSKVLEYIKSNYDPEVLILPPVYFYPFSDSTLVSKSKSFIKPQTFAVHYWNTSWIKK